MIVLMYDTHIDCCLDAALYTGTLYGDVRHAPQHAIYTFGHILWYILSLNRKNKVST